ncbi:GH25 family lysozyme [Pseudarthrobacter oxydans]|uniref:GH25 family lysozyme n=1 Tax=Pseudarthrobacter oxydans TaxID=1671 RepID=UPI003F508DAB
MKRNLSQSRRPAFMSLGIALLAATLAASPGVAGVATAVEPTPAPAVSSPTTATPDPVPTSPTTAGSDAVSPSPAVPSPSPTPTETASVETASPQPAPTTAQSMAEAVGVGGAEMGQRSARVTAAAPSGAVKRLSTESLSSEGTWMPTFGVQGLDVSGHQPSVDWQQQWNMGARFAYVKATEGNYYKNPSYSSQYQGSRNVGMIRGAYHFAIPNWSSGADQARYFVQNGGGWSADGYTMPPVLDFEFNPYEGRTINGFYFGNTCYNMSPSQLQSWVRDFGNTMQALTGRLPVIYTNTSWWNQCLANPSGFGDYPLWIAAYPSSPTNNAGPVPTASWSGYSMWQYSSTGPFAGDSNVWNGDYASLQRFARAGSGIEEAFNREYQASSSWLGNPWGPIACGLVNNGCYQIFQGGSIQWSPATGAHSVRDGAIRGTYQRSGSENGPLGYPVFGPEICGLKGGGCYQMFQGGAVIWNSVTGAQISLAGPIRDRYASMGFENGPLGYPTSSQVCGLASGGCSQSFQGGDILWSSGSGAYAVTAGAIRANYGSLGAQGGQPGYPVSNEVCGLKNGGCYQFFQGGSMIWSSTTGAHFSPFGSIRGVWASQNFENGWLGYPFTNEYCSSSGECRQDFQGGSLIWTPKTGVSVYRR